jgi:hypothetical protein
MNMSGKRIQQFPGNQRLRVGVKLNLRDAPSYENGIVQVRVEPNTILEADELWRSDTEYRNNALWYKKANEDLYFWSGGVSIITPEKEHVAPKDLNVHRRNDGTIIPLSNSEIKAIFGDLHEKEIGKGRIEVSPAWESGNLEVFSHALLERVNFPRLRIHKLAKPYFKTVFDQIEADQNVRDDILSCAGTYVPRHKGWDSSRDLSSHSWGIAIDLNATWNGYGQTPAPRGQQGSLVDVARYFTQNGFAWGGHFSGKQMDGMHFELALLNP